MRYDVRVRAEGTVRDLRALDRDIEGAVDTGLNRVAVRVSRTARRRGYGFTDRTGRLRGSIRVLDRARRRGGGVRRAVVGATAAYAGAVEYGHGGRYSYIRRAADAVRRNAERDVDRAVDGAIARDRRTRR